MLLHDHLDLMLHHLELHLDHLELLQIHLDHLCRRNHHVSVSKQLELFDPKKKKASLC